MAGGIGFSLVVLAAVAFQVLPLDWGSMGLILIGIILLILEIFVTSYGLLSLAGLAAFTMGSLFLFHGDTGFISVKYPVLLSTLAGVFGAVGLLVWYLFREQKKQVKIQDFFLPMGSTGIILTKLESQIFQVKVNGEIWKATSHDDLQIGDLGEVISVDNKKLMLTIKKV